MIHLWIVFTIGRTPRGGINCGYLLPFFLLVGFILLITAITGKNPNGLHVPNGEYWRSPEHYQEAMAHIRAAMAWFAALLGIWIDLITIMVMGAKNNARGNVNGPFALGLVAGFIGIMTLFVTLISSGWDIPVTVLTRFRG